MFNDKLQPVFGIAAAVMSGVVFTLGVYLPTRLGAEPADLQSVAVAHKRTPVAIEPARIEVIGARAERTAANAHVNEAIAPNG